MTSRERVVPSRLPSTAFSMPPSSLRRRVPIEKAACALVLAMAVAAIVGGAIRALPKNSCPRFCNRTSTAL